MTESSILIISYTTSKIMKTITEFKKFAIRNNIKKPSMIKDSKIDIKIHGCVGTDLKKKTLLIEGPLEILEKLPRVKIPKGVILQFK